MPAFTTRCAAAATPLALAVSLAPVSATTHAAEPVLSEIIVTADRLSLPVASLPISVRIVDAAGLERQPVRDASAALALLPNVTVRRSGSVFDEGSVTMYGVSGQPRAPSRTVIAIDGVPLNSGLIPETSLNLLPLQMATRLDVIQGPGSVGYGSNATTGVINLVTFEPRASTGFVRVSAGDEWSTSAVDGMLAGGNGNGRKWIASGAWRTTDGHLQPGGRGNFSDSTLWSAALTGRQNLGKVTVTGTYLRYAFDRQDPSLLTVGTPADLTSRKEEGWRDHFNAGVAWDWTPAFKGELRYVRNAASEESRQTFQQPAIGQAAANPANQDTLSQAVQGQLTWRAGPQLFSAGAEYLQADLDNNVTGQSLSGNLRGLFVQYSYEMRDRGVTLLAGYRHDDSSTFTESSSSPKLGAVWSSPADVWRVRVNVSSAYNAPTFAELYGSGFIRGNAALKAQTLELREAGVTWHPLASLSVDLSAYRADLENPIFPRVNPALGINVRQYQNVGPNVVNEGWVLAADWRPTAGLRLSGSWTYLDPGAFTFHTAEDAIKLQADYAEGPWSIGLAGRTESDRYWRDNFEARADDYTVVDVRAGWSFTQTLRLDLLVENVTDEAYATTASIGATTSIGIPRPGRLVTLSLRAGF